MYVRPSWKFPNNTRQTSAQATVMLNANVAFLAIPDVIIFPDNDVQPGAGTNIQNYLTPLRSPAAIASYVSILCSVGSIVLGLMLVRHNRTRSRDNSPEAVSRVRYESIHCMI